MKEYIKQIAEDYVNGMGIDSGVFAGYDEIIEYAEVDFTAGINRVLQHPEEFGLQTKEYV